jgi:hypothetical protein
MKRLLGTLVLSTCLSACTAQGVWTKPELTLATWQHDQYACERDMRMSIASFGHLYTRAYYAQKFYHKCLEVKGYTKIQP